MVSWIRPLQRLTFLMAAICLSFTVESATGSQPPQCQTGQQPPTQASSAARPMGTIKAISGNTILLTTDAGGDVTVQVGDATRLVRSAPGQKDSKDTTSIQLTAVQPGHRILA